MEKVRFVARRHDDETGQAAEIGYIERARMSLAVIADQTGAVDRKAHRQFLDRDIVHDLVKGALQECRIDRGERLHALGGEAGGEGHRVLFGDADVEAPLRKFVAEQVEPGSRRHGGGDGDDTVVGFGFLDQRFGEDAGIGRRGRLRFHLGAGDDIELGDAVPLVLGLLGRQIAVTLLGHGVNQDRSRFLAVADVLQDRQ